MVEILLSMKPEWFYKVITGEKIFEYRKNFPNDKNVRAYIYVSAPIKAVLGIFDFEAKINLLDWMKVYSYDKETCSRIKRKLEENRFAVPVKRVFITNSISLNNMRDNIGGFVAPQMYYLLKPEMPLTEFLHRSVKVKNCVVENSFDKVEVEDICKEYEMNKKEILEQLSLFDFINDDTKSEHVDEYNPRLVSLFSGCGGMDLGFKNAGYNIVYANDFDKDAQRVYEHNLGNIDKRSILDVDVEEIPECDILCAGFPCQPFSNAGNRKGVNDARGNLYKECLRVITAKLPKVVVFENVRGLLTIKDENNNLLIDTIVKNLSEIEIGYNVSYKLINASDYGVPQNRLRVVLVAIRKDINKTFQFPETKSKEGLNVGSLLDIPETVPNQVDWPLSPQAMHMIENIPEGGSWKSIPYEILPERFKKIRDNMARYHAPNMYRRFSRDEIAGTITASAQPENCGIIHPLHNRRFNIREIARIQTFPDNFLFFDENKKTITGMYKVIGNAVPPKLAEVIAMAIKEQVGDDFKE